MQWFVNTIPDQRKFSSSLLVILKVAYPRRLLISNGFTRCCVNIYIHSHRTTSPTEVVLYDELINSMSLGLVVLLLLDERLQNNCVRSICTWYVKHLNQNKNKSLHTHTILRLHYHIFFKVVLNCSVIFVSFCEHNVFTVSNYMRLTFWTFIYVYQYIHKKPSLKEYSIIYLSGPSWMTH